MAVWTFIPQGVLEETFTAAAHVSKVSPRTDHAGRVTEELVRAFRCTYSVVESAAAMAMGQFFDARRGGFEAFSFIHPMDSRAYQVRFDSGLTRAQFLAGLFQTGEVRFTVVQS